MPNKVNVLLQFSMSFSHSLVEKSIDWSRAIMKWIFMHVCVNEFSRIQVWIRILIHFALKVHGAKFVFCVFEIYIHTPSIAHSNQVEIQSSSVVLFACVFTHTQSSIPDAKRCFGEHNSWRIKIDHNYSWWPTRDKPCSIIW